MVMGNPQKRVLISTVYMEKEEHYDYWGENVSSNLRYSYNKDISYGLRFLKMNIPEINILEYPTKKEFAEEVDKGYDIVGFSFFTHEIPKIMQMVKIAERKGIEELWAGHYGALTYGMEEVFDRIFVGYGERELAESMGSELNRIKHPILVDTIGLPWGLRLFPLGILFTSRGCNNNCSFCQTSVFCSKPRPISIESIEEVLKIYDQMGVNDILIQDENFGLHRKHTRKILDLLVKYSMDWYAMTRIDILNKNLEYWYEKGFSGALLGIESLRQTALDKINKDIEVDQTTEVLKKLQKINAFVIGYYMIGFENDTEETIKKSVKRLNEFSIDMTQICILTPFPKTKLWDHIDENYGIFDDDWSHWDTKHLVWNHPNIEPEKMRELLKWGCREAYSYNKFFRTPLKVFKMHRKKYGRLKTYSHMIGDVIRSQPYNKSKKPPFLYKIK